MTMKTIPSLLRRDSLFNQDVTTVTAGHNRKALAS